MADTFLGLSAAGTLISAATPGELTSPLQLGDDGKIIVTGSGTAQGYLCITDKGLLAIGDKQEGAVVQIATGNNHSLFLLSDGRVYSCGNNSHGQLGRNVRNGGVASINLGQIDGLSPVVDISASSAHSLILLSDGTVYTCGSNYYGELGRVVENGGQSNTN